MTADAILSAICLHFNGMDGHPPVLKSPVNAAAPVGVYVAVGCSAVEQSGSAMLPGWPGDGKSAFEQVATVTFTEVEGDGETLRAMRNAMQGRGFLETAWAAGFTLWDLTAIAAVDTFDGEFVVRQWRFTARFNFEDAGAEDAPKIETVTVDVGAEE